MKRKGLIAKIMVLCLCFSVAIGPLTGFALSKEANICAELGMLKGDNQGVNDAYMNSPCTRLQGAVMLLRLMQKEKEATGYALGQDFKDTQGLEWAPGRNMLRYLKDNPNMGFGGYPDGTFKPNDPFTGQQYGKVLLEVLGYKANEDYTWDTVFDFASSLGLNTLNPGKTLTMEDVAKATVQALKIKTKGKGETLAAQMVAQGTLDDVLASKYGLLTAVKPPVPSSNAVLQAKDIRYLGAFRLPNESDEYGWMWSGEALCFNAQGDGGQGSLFGTGHNQLTQVSEISIPEPVNTRIVSNMPTARTLQPFTDIRGSLYSAWNIEIPRTDLEVLNGRLYFCWGDHMEDDASLPTHGYTDLNLSSSNSQGLWRVGGANFTYSTNDYLFKIPQNWSNHYAPGYDLVTGRFRDGGWGGMGPSLIMIKSSTMAPGQIVSGKEIIRYTDVQDYDSARHTINNYSEADSWSGGAWVDSPAGGAVIFAGTHGYGNSWYGFANGVVYPLDGDGPFPEVPPYPYDQRGWWNSDFRSVMMLYSPIELAKVAQNQKKPYEMQPYAVIDLSQYMLIQREQTVMQYLGAMAYDDVKQRLYVMELHADEDKPVIHVFGIGAQ